MKISATEANRNFSKLLAKVRKGQSADITVRGEVVARLEAVSQRDSVAEVKRRQDWEKFMDELRRRPVLGIPRGTRDELYDDD
jgi:prevent-host-death family protein